MENILLNEIPFNLEAKSLSKLLGIQEKTESFSILGDLVERAKAVAKPKVLYKTARVGEKGDDWVELDGVKLNSRVLVVNLYHAGNAYPYVVTCGTELDEWAASFDGDPMEKFLAEAVMGMGLGMAMRALDADLRQRFYRGEISHQSPGSIEQWPLSDQKGLFEILGDVKDQIGVTLKETFFMSPQKTSSGIKFPNDDNFENCALCTQETCPGRKAPYDDQLLKTKFA